MNAHASPPAARRPRLVTLTCGMLLGGCLAASAQSQQRPAQQPAPQPTSPILTSHDDPVVIDNPKIEIARKATTAGPKEESQDGKRWSIDKIGAFYRMEVKTNDMTTPKVVSLAGLTAVQLDLVENNALADAHFVVSQERIDEQHWKVFVQAFNDLTFEKDHPQTPRKIRDKLDKLHVGQIRYGSKFVCLAETGEPKDGPCASWARTPTKTEIKLCSNDKCRQLTEAERRK